MQFFNRIHRAVTMMLFLFILGLLTSCDCMQRIQGFAIDAETKEPLSKVFYTRDRLLTQEERLVDINDPLYHYHRKTDSVGWFSDFRLANGLHCKPYSVLWLEKEGYKPVRLEWQRNKSNLDTLVVELHRTETR
jgi:hypothetical protein